MVILLEYGDICVALLREMVGCGETEGTSTEDNDGIRLGDAHIGNLQFVWNWERVDIPSIYTIYSAA